MLRPSLLEVLLAVVAATRQSLTLVNQDRPTAFYLSSATNHLLGEKKKALSRERGTSLKKLLLYDTKYISLDTNQKGFDWNLNGDSQIINATKCSAFRGLQYICLSFSAVGR